MNIKKLKRKQNEKLKHTTSMTKYPTFNAHAWPYFSGLLKRQITYNLIDSVIKADTYGFINVKYSLFFSMFTRIIFLFSISSIGQSSGAYGLTIYIVRCGHSWDKRSYNQLYGIKIRFWERLICICWTGILWNQCYWICGLVTEHTMNKQLLLFFA